MKEIERKFLVKDKHEIIAVAREHIVQVYLSDEVRVRSISRQYGEVVYYLTVKSLTDNPTIRDEYEYRIPADDGQQLITQFSSRGCVIEKDRFTTLSGWIVDEFHGEFEGLMIAKFELRDRMNWPDPLPSWVGQEVTGDQKYSNAHLFKYGLDEVWRV